MRFSNRARSSGEPTGGRHAASKPLPSSNNTAHPARIRMRWPPAEPPRLASKRMHVDSCAPTRRGVIVAIGLSTVQRVVANSTRPRASRSVFASVRRGRGPHDSDACRLTERGAGRPPTVRKVARVRSVRRRWRKLTIPDRHIPATIGRPPRTSWGSSCGDAVDRDRAARVVRRVRPDRSGARACPRNAHGGVTRVPG